MPLETLEKKGETRLQIVSYYPDSTPGSIISQVCDFALLSKHSTHKYWWLIDEADTFDCLV